VLPNIALERLNGGAENIQHYANKVVLVVNVASVCGFTPQYHQLQVLYDEFHQQGLEILGFPCNQFGGQEPGSADQIQTFCQTNYGVTFPMFQKTDVNGLYAHPLFEYLRTTTPKTLETDAITWNFTKFLINRNGMPIKRYDSAILPKNIRVDIQELI